MARVHLEHGRAEARGRAVASGQYVDQPRVLIDLLLASTGIEPEIVHSAEAMTVLEVQLPVATIPFLIAMKVLARNDRKRPQDWDDLRGLVRNASPDMLLQARSALALIEARGAHRGRDVMSMLDEAIHEFLGSDQ